MSKNSKRSRMLEDCDIIVTAGVPYSYYKRCMNDPFIPYFISRYCFYYFHLDIKPEHCLLVIDSLKDTNEKYYPEEKGKKFISRAMIKDIMAENIYDKVNSVFVEKYGGNFTQEIAMYQTIYIILFIIGYVKIYGEEFNFNVNAYKLFNDDREDKLLSYLSEYFKEKDKEE